MKIGNKYYHYLEENKQLLLSRKEMSKIITIIFITEKMYFVAK